MFREDVGRCRLRLPLQAQKLSDLLPGGARGAGTHKKRSQQDAGRYRCNRKPSASAAALGRERIDLRPRRGLLHAPVGICSHRESIGGVPAVEKITPGETGVTWAAHLSTNAPTGSAGILPAVPRPSSPSARRARTLAGQPPGRRRYVQRLGTSEEDGGSGAAPLPRWASEC